MSGRRLPTLIAALVLAFAAGTADAGQVLRLRKGDLIAGRVTALDADGVTFAPDSGGQMRVAWDQVVPLSRYELWESTLGADDAQGRVALGRWALSAELWLYARRELLKAKGLGYAGPDDLTALVAQVDKTEADAALADVEELVAAGELDKALARVRTYLRCAPPGEHAERVRVRVADLVARIERRDELEREEEEQRRKAAKAGKLQDWIRSSVEAARKLEDDAGRHAVDGFTHLAKGNQTRARDALAAAETGFQDARDIYRRVRKSAGPGTTCDECDRRMKECDRRTVEVLVRLGRMEADQKAWKRASPIVDRGLRIDPVNRELLELRREIDENWARRRLSDITNAEPR